MEDSFAQAGDAEVVGCKVVAGVAPAIFSGSNRKLHNSPQPTPSTSPSRCGIGGLRPVIAPLGEALRPTAPDPELQFAPGSFAAEGASRVRLNTS